MKLSKLLLYGALLIVLLLALAAGGLLLTLAYRPQALEPGLEQLGSHILGRDISVGELSAVKLGRDTAMELRGLQLANPTWAGPDPMLSVGYVKLVINLPSLWGDGSILVREVVLRDSHLDLREDEGEGPNWLFELNVPFAAKAETAESDTVLFPIIIEHGALAAVSVLYRDPDQHVAVDIAAFTLQREARTGMSATHLAGTVNEMPLRGDGFLGPTAALQTGLNLQLEQEITLGDLELSARGTVADALVLQGADLLLRLNAPRSRPLLDLIGLEEVRDGPMHFEGRLADARPGLRIEAEGELAGFGLGAHGVIADPRGLDGLALEFYADGPSMAEAGAILGLEGFKDVPFDVSGKLSRRGSLLVVERGQFRAAQGWLSLTLTLPQFPGIDDWAADVRGQDLNLSVLGPMLGVEGLPDLLCAVEGSLSADEQGVELMELSIDEGDLAFVVSGIVGDLPELQGTVLQARIKGSDLSRLNRVLGLETLPAAPFSLSGTISRLPEDWHVDDVQLEARGIELDASARADRLVGAESMVIAASGSSPDLASTLRDYGMGVDTVRPVPLQVAATVQIGREGIEVNDLRGKAGSVSFHGSGRLGPGGALAGSSLRLEARGDSLGEAMSALAEAEIPSQPFRLSMDATYHDPLVTIDRLEGEIGGNQISAQLRLDQDSGQQVARGQASLRGDSVQSVLDLAGVDLQVVDGPYTFDSALALSADRLDLSGLRLVGANSDWKGELSLGFSDVPRLDVNLHSSGVDATRLVPDPERAETQEEQAAEVAAQAQIMEMPTRQEMAERVIPDTPLPLAWMSSIEGRWRYRADRISYRDGASSQLLVDLELEDQVLKTHKLAWNGNVSQGWMELGIDARQPRSRIELDLSSNQLPLLWIVTQRDAPSQEATYRGRLLAEGATVRELASSLQGALLMRGGGSKVNNRGLDLVLGDVFGSVFDRLNPFSEADKYTMVECSTAGVQAENGILSITPGLVVRTDKIDIVSHGTLDLNTEALDIAFNTLSRKGIGISAGKAITPYLKLAGNLAHPWITLDPQAVVVSGGMAVATGGLSILAEGLWDRWVATAKSPCQELFKQIRRDEKYRPLLAMPAPDLTAGAAEPSINSRESDDTE